MRPTGATAPVRLYAHPGSPPVPQRIFAALGGKGSRRARAWLPAGLSLQAAILGAAARLGGRSGAARLYGGALAATKFTTGGPDRHGNKLANYTWFREWGACRLVAGEASFGIGRTGDPLVHAHTLLLPEADAVPAADRPVPDLTGGHMMPSDCRIGAPILVDLVVYRDIDLIQTDDPETTHSIFEPVAAGNPAEGPMTGVTDSDGAAAIAVETGRTGRIAMIRLRPNEDLVQGVEKACLSLGIRNAYLRGSLGSVNHACLETALGTVATDPSVGQEVVTLSGSVLSDGTGAIAADLHGAVVDTSGRMTAGRFVPGRNPVCITAEIAIEEWLPDAG